MWSLGLLCHFMAYGSIPFGRSTNLSDVPISPQEIRLALLEFKNQQPKGNVDVNSIPLQNSILVTEEPIVRPLEMKQLIAALLSPVSDAVHTSLYECDSPLKYFCLGS